MTNFPGKSLVHALGCLTGFDQPHTQTTVLERDTISKWATGRRCAAEIGVYEGRTTRVIAEALRGDGELFAIDPFLAGRVGICWAKLIVSKHLRESRCEARIHMIELFSYQAADQVKRDLDFLFVDGDHSLEGIERDWKDWSGKVAEGGIVALHDTKVPRHNPRVADLGSYQFFESVIRRDSRFELLEQADSLSVLRRRSIEAA